MNESTLVSLDHRAGEDISNISTLDQLLSTSNLDFQVEKTALYTPEGDEVTDKYLIRRTDNKFNLGVVGAKYTPIDTRITLEPFHNMVMIHKAQYESAGVVRGGKKCWVSATLPNRIQVPGRTDDIIQQRVVCLINNDGLGGNSYFSLANRVVCNNQIRMLTKHANNSQFKFRHTKNWEAGLQDAAVGFNEALKARAEFEQVIMYLSKFKMTEREMVTFAKRLYNVNDKEEMTAKSKARTDRLVELFGHGAGNNGTTRWDALNAVTEWVDHHSGRSYKTHAQTLVANQNRFITNNFSGTGDRIKQRAVNLLNQTEVSFK